MKTEYMGGVQNRAVARPVMRAAPEADKPHGQNMGPMGPMGLMSPMGCGLGAGKTKNGKWCPKSVRVCPKWFCRSRPSRTAIPQNSQSSQDSQIMKNVEWSRCLPRMREKETLSKMWGAGVQNVERPCPECPTGPTCLTCPTSPSLPRMREEETLSKMWLSPIGPIRPISPIKALYKTGVQNVYKTENRCAEGASIVSEMFCNTGVQNVRAVRQCPFRPSWTRLPDYAIRVFLRGLSLRLSVE